MHFPGLLVKEIFFSIQGESSLSGVPFIFIRLSGCNLRCTYCDTSYSFKGGETLSITEIQKRIEPMATQHVLLTGGEPLLQRNTLPLVLALKERYLVSIETHGEISIEHFAAHARIVMDIKTPSSKMNRNGYLKNLCFLKPSDEIKFVIASPEDYVWAKTILKKELIGIIPPQTAIFMSPAIPDKSQPGSFEPISLQWLAENIIQDQLPVRLQTQLHKLIWGPNKKGV